MEPTFIEFENEEKLSKFVERAVDAGYVKYADDDLEYEEGENGELYLELVYDDEESVAALGQIFMDLDSGDATGDDDEDEEDEDDDEDDQNESVASLNRLGFKFRRKGFNA